MERTAGGRDRVDAVSARAVAQLLALPGVRRVGLALSEGGGRRLRFTASDRDNSRSVDWCHIDAYDDVPLTTVMRTGQGLFGTLDDLDERYAAFAAHQRTQETVALAALPLPGGASPLGGLILYYDEPQSFDAAQRSRLDAAASGLGDELGAAQLVRPGDIPALADEPVPPGILVDDRVVDAAPQALGDVRGWARTTLRRWDLDDDLVGDAVLCLSELVTNVVIHTRAACQVRLALGDGTLTVTVRDEGVTDSLDAFDLADDPLRVHGRGLTVVSALAAEWGSNLEAEGTTVWCTFQTAGSHSGAVAR